MIDFAQENWHAHLTVAVVIEDRGKYLVVEEIAEQGTPVINQPAGHVERAERIDQAAIREALEETGWEVELSGVIGFYLFHAGTNDTTYFRVCFAAKAIKHYPDRALDDGILSANWLSHDELKNSAIPLRSELVLRCIRDYESGNRFPLSCLAHVGI